jgi:DsbC/DsbD-like thiol-disulfide interchange protein
MCTTSIPLYLSGFVFALLSISSTAWAQLESPVKWSSSAKKESQTVAVISLKATLKPGWHIFSQHLKPKGPTPTSLRFTPSDEFQLIGSASEPKAKSYYEKLFKMDLSYFEDEVIFSQKIQLLNPKKSSRTIQGIVEFMACNEKECLPPDEAEFTVSIK